MVQELHPFGGVNPHQVSLSVDASRSGSKLRLEYRLTGALEKLRLPSFSPNPARLDELWRTTCFEAFVSRPGEPRYVEINASPSGDWNAYRFDEYRKGMRPEALPPLAVRGFRVDGDFRLVCEADLSALGSGPWELGVTAVLDFTDKDEPEYWALMHAGDKPDFHLRPSFTFNL